MLDKLKNILKNIKIDFLLKKMNKKATLSKFSHSDNKIDFDSEYRIAILGNSISILGEAPDIGWNYEWGMAASSKASTYIHILIDALSQKYNNKKINVIYTNLAQFERKPHKFDFSILKDFLDYNPDLVLFQLGDNFEVKYKKHLINKYCKLIKLFKNSKKFIFLPFFNNEKKEKIIKIVSQKTQADIINIAQFSKNEKNLARSEAWFKNSTIQCEGVGMHPSDKGMECIAKEIFNKITL